MIEVLSLRQWYDLALVSVSILRRHEQHEIATVTSLCETIKKTGFWSKPIIVERDDFIILDGHHRYEAALRLGLTRVPCALVTYKNANIEVSPWRESESIDHEAVRRAALTGKLMPIKTSRHSFKTPIEEERIPLANLKQSIHA